MLGVDKQNVRVLTGNVGGSFGMKSQVYPEYFALFHAAKTLGRPEANYYMERLVDTAAAEMGLDRVDLRRRNHIPEGAMPHKGPEWHEL